MGEFKYVLIIITSNPKVHYVIYIIVANIPESYGLSLSIDWCKNLDGYFAIDWSHLLLPYKG